MSGSILKPGANEIAAACAVISAASVYEPFEETARKALQAAADTRKLPSGTAAETLLELCDAVSWLRGSIHENDMLDKLPHLVLRRLDLALVQARRTLQGMQAEQRAES